MESKKTNNSTESTDQLSESEVQLLVSEYESHQARYRQLAAQSVWWQNAILIFSAAIWSWALGRKSSSFSHIFLFAPTILNVIFMFKGWQLHKFASSIHQRLGEIEGFMAREKYRFFASKEKSPTHFKFKNWLISYWTIVFLINVLLLTLALIFFDRIWTSA